MRTERDWTRPTNSVINGLENRCGILTFRIIPRLNMVFHFTYTGHDDTYAMQRLPGRFGSQNCSFLAFVIFQMFFKISCEN